MAAANLSAVKLANAVLLVVAASLLAALHAGRRPGGRPAEGAQLRCTGTRDARAGIHQRSTKRGRITGSSLLPRWSPDFIETQKVEEAAEAASQINLYMTK